MKKHSKSFITGAVALVFAVVGYQAALLVNYSAITKIAANRDHPDTIYIYETVPAREGRRQSTERSYGHSGGTQPRESRQRVERRNAPHTQQVARARGQVPPRSVQNFRFDPNTATVEELVMLGFSPKQAQSIDNYRSKGGKFRRKEDFAKSYVVSDSIYRRLEPYIDIARLDINTADSAAFDALPGIGGYFARMMVEQRKRLHGYSYPEQLMDIRNFDAERFGRIADLITVSEPLPYPLWTLPADSLRLHPYIRSAATARSIVFFRDHNPPGSWTVENLGAAGVLSAEDTKKLSRCKIDGIAQK